MDRDRDRQGQQKILATRWTNARTRSPLSAWTIYARLANRVQITIDGHSAYLEAVEGAFGGDVDFAQLVKLYGKPIGKKGYERKYPPSECVSVNGGAKLVPPGGAKPVHLTLCGTQCWGVVPVVHRRDPRCFV